MANSNTGEDVFRFLTLRNPNPPPDSSTLVKTAVDGNSASAFAKELIALRTANADRNLFEDAAKKVAKVAAEAAPWLQQVDTRIAQHESRYSRALIMEEGFANFLEGVPDMAAVETAKSSLGDAILAAAIVGVMDPRDNELRVRYLKICHLIGLVASKRWLKRPLSLTDTIARISIVLPTNALPSMPRSHTEVDTEVDTASTPPAERSERMETLEQRPHARRAALRDANERKISELRDAAQELGDRAWSAVEFRGAPVPEERQLGRLGSFFDRLLGRSGSPVLPAGQPLEIPSITSDVFRSLSEDTQTTLLDEGADPERLQPATVIGNLEKRIGRLIRDMPLPARRQQVLLDGIIINPANPFEWDLQGIEWLVDPIPGANVAQASRLLPQTPIPTGPGFYYAGQADLRIVRQKLIRYELSEFAHVENVLAGEYRERSHRRLDRTEEETTTLEETERDTERDTQSTEKDEIQQQVQRDTAVQMNLEAGLTVTGSYGPSVDFTASTNAAISFSSEQSRSRSQRHAKEVIDRAVEKIRTLTREQRRRVVIREVEESNRHGINNQDPRHGHIRGIYRWINKVYKAQIYNLGQRAMYEFVVPEPAANLRQVFLNQSQSNGITIDVPVAPDVTPASITRDNWHQLVAENNVVGVPAPPPAESGVSHVFSEVKTSSQDFAGSASVTIPEGYQAVGARVSFARVKGHNSSYSAVLHVGNQSYGFKEDASTYKPFAGVDGHGSIPIAWRIWKVKTYAFGIEIRCKLKQEMELSWQTDVYDAIMDSYVQRKADYDARVAAALAREQMGAVQVPGANPLDNRRTMLAELKRSCLSLILENNVRGFDAFTGAPPNFDFNQARALGIDVGFFERAFEWNNTTYLFYPYFWGRNEQWPVLYNPDSGADQQFAAFLAAGAARVQVPVRPGYEAAVALAVSGVDPYQGEDAPLIDDPLYVAMVDEVKASQNTPPEGNPEPDPWEVTVPTSLVFLQGPGQVKFRDALNEDTFGGAGSELAVDLPALAATDAQAEDSRAGGDADGPSEPTDTG